MGRHDEYLNYSYSRKRRGRRSGGPFIGILVVVLLALAAGFTTYHLTSGSLGDRWSQGQFAGFLDGEHIEPTQVAVVTEAPVTAAPIPTKAPTLTPTPVTTPHIYQKDYLVDYVDNREKVQVRGIYAADLTLRSSKLDYYINLCKTTELNAIVINVKNDDGTISYMMDCESAEKAGTLTDNQGDVKALVEKLHENGIYCIARIVCFRDEKIQETNPGWLLSRKDGSRYKDTQGIMWVNPYNESACKYIVDVACQAAADGFDEICFDYIRTATSYVSTIDFGAKAVEDHTLTEQIVEFTKYACNRLKPMGVFVSASVYGIVINSSVDAEAIGQDYTELAKYLDYICPMIYPSHYAETYAGIARPDAAPYELVDHELQSSNKKLAAVQQVSGQQLAECRPWLQSFTASWLDHYIKYTTPVIRKQVDACYDNGIQAWMYWNAAGNYDEDAFKKN